MAPTYDRPRPVSKMVNMVNYFNQKALNFV